MPDIWDLMALRRGSGGGGGSVYVDPTLSISGDAADAKVTGDIVALLSDSKIGKPTNDDDGKIPRAKRGDVEWVTVGQPTDSQTNAAVHSWLDTHPEATTTVQDGSLTEAKFAQNVLVKHVKDETDFSNVVNNEGNTYVTLAGTIEINSPIVINNRTSCAHKRFVGGVFILNSNMFSWTNLASYWNIPHFDSCSFIGNGYNICADGAYPINGHFSNCTFIDCGIVKNGEFSQSQRFINCRIAMGENHPFIEAKRVYDTRFVCCQVESDNKAPLVVANTTQSNVVSTSEISFSDCIIEGQDSEIVNMHDGGVSFTNCYTEKTKELVIVKDSTRASNGIVRIHLINCRIQPVEDTYAILVGNGYSNSTNSEVAIENCSINVGHIINKNDFMKYSVKNVTSAANGTFIPSDEISHIDTAAKNSIAEFSTTPGHVIVKKAPCLICYYSSSGGWHTELVFVSNIHNVARATSITNPTKVLTALITEDGFANVTLDPIPSDNRFSVVYLDGLRNQLNPSDFWKPGIGYDV